MRAAAPLLLFATAAGGLQLKSPLVTVRSDPAHFQSSAKTDFATLEDAITAATPGATISIPSEYREAAVVASHTITASRNNLHIECGHGATFQVGASNAAVFTINGASGVTIHGCAFDGQFSQHSYAGTSGVTSIDSSDLTVTDCIFRNFYGRGINGRGRITGAQISHNKFLNFGNRKVSANGGYEGILLNDSLRVDIEHNYFENFTTDDAIHLFNNSGPADGGSARVIGNTGTGMARIAIEVQGIFWAHLDVRNNSFDTWTQEGMCISTGLATPVNFGRKSLAVGEVVEGNYCIQPTDRPLSHSLALEMLSDNDVITNNTIAGPWGTAIVVGGVNAKVTRNTIIGPADQAITVNPGYLVTDARITENTIQEPKSTCINVGAADAAGDIIARNSCVRTPGHWPGDSAGRFAHISIAASSGPALVEDNMLVLESAAIPAGFDWVGGVTLTGNASGTTFANNTIWNKNTSSFGTGYWSNAKFFDGTTITGGRNINLARIGSYADDAAITYSENKSLPGAGSSPATDWTITPTTFGHLGAPPNGNRNYCSDCAVKSDNTCASGGTGAETFRVNGAWICVAKTSTSADAPQR